jgi:hypothetical protein
MAPSRRQDSDYEYDVVLSFAGEDRPYVAQVAEALRLMGIRLFYDDYEQVMLWGKDLGEHLDWVYRKAGRYCVLFISRHYAEKLWTNHERKSAQARAIEANLEYILPTRFDDTEVPGLRPTIHYLNLMEWTPEALAEAIREKIGPIHRSNYLPPYPDLLLDALDVLDNAEREAVVLSHASSFMRAMVRTTVEERDLLSHIFGSGCPSHLPENVHIDIDYLRRSTGVAPAEILRTMKGLSSLGFESELVAPQDLHPESDEDVTDGDDEPTVLVVQWHNMSADDDVAGNATDVADKMFSLILRDSCRTCASEALIRLDFSNLSSVTVSEDEHTQS